MYGSSRLISPASPR